MKILFVSPEVAPYAKTGGLADVASALPRALAARGHDVRIVMPMYRCVDPQKLGLRLAIPEIWINTPGRHLFSRVYEGRHPMPEPAAPRARTVPRPAADSVPIYFVDCPELFDRPTLYGEYGEGYADNADRFALFDLAILWILKALDWAPDIIHCNDWQSAFVPVLLRSLVRSRYDRFFARTRILFSIHNLAYQGLCDGELLERLGLSPALLQAECMEFWGWLSPLKGGIAFSDWIATVSPTYAREILTPEFGCGIEGFIATRADRLTGILNGVDAAEWNPAADPDIAAKFAVDNLAGKAKCKDALQKQLRLPQDRATPLLAMINRLDEQKGIELLLEALPRLMGLGAQLVILGSGREDYHRLLQAAARRYKERLRVRLEFDNHLAHTIEAGADAFLMLSSYEPCGLNQMYSQRYGTLPVVHAVGGLADTVTDLTPETLAAGTANGFRLTDYSPEGLIEKLESVLRVYRDEPETWRQVQRRAMEEDHSWDRSAAAYEDLYRQMLGRPSPFVPEWLG